MLLFRQRLLTQLGLALDFLCFKIRYFNLRFCLRCLYLLTFIPQYSLSPDIKQWAFNVSPFVAEPDDALHAPDPPNAGISRGTVFSDRGILNLGCLIVLCVGLVTLL